MYNSTYRGAEFELPPDDTDGQDVSQSAGNMATAGFEAQQEQQKNVSFRAACNQYQIVGKLLEMLIAHPGYSSSLEDKISGVQVSKKLLENISKNIIIKMNWTQNSVGVQEKLKKHIVPVLVTIWSNCFSTETPHQSFSETEEMATKFFIEAANMLDVEAEDMFLSENPDADIILAKLSAMTRLQCVLKPIIESIEETCDSKDMDEKFKKMFRKRFFGDFSNRDIVDKLFEQAERKALTFVGSYDIEKLSIKEKSIIHRITLAQSVNILQSILESGNIINKLGALAKESSPNAEALFFKWASQQYEDWTHGLPTFESIISKQDKKTVNEPKQ